MPRGLERFVTPQFDREEAQAIVDMINEGRRGEADELLRHYVHSGVAPTELFEAAMNLARQET